MVATSTKTLIEINSICFSSRLHKLICLDLSIMLVPIDSNELMLSLSLSLSLSLLLSLPLALLLLSPVLSLWMSLLIVAAAVVPDDIKTC